MKQKSGWAACLLVLLACCEPTWAGIITSVAIDGFADAIVRSDPSAGFSGTESCSASGTGSALCTATGNFSATDGTNASITIGVSAYAEASFGHIEFNEQLSTSYFNGAYSRVTGGNRIDATSSAFYSDSIEFGGHQPSFIQLTFLSLNNSAFDGPGINQHYSVILGSDSPWTFTQQAFDPFNIIKTHTFAVDPLAGSALLQVQAVSSGEVMFQDDGNIHHFASLDLQSILFLDANCNPIPETSCLLLCSFGMILMLMFCRRKNVSARARRVPALLQRALSGGGAEVVAVDGSATVSSPRLPPISSSDGCRDGAWSTLADSPRASGRFSTFTGMRCC